MRYVLTIIFCIAFVAFAQIDADYKHVDTRVDYHYKQGTHKLNAIYLSRNDSTLKKLLPGTKKFRKYTIKDTLSDNILHYYPIYPDISAAILDSLVSLTNVKYVSFVEVGKDCTGIVGTDSTKNISGKTVSQRKQWVRRLIKNHKYIKASSLQ